MPTPFETIKARLREAVDDVLRGATASRPARVTVVRTERPAKGGKSTPALLRIYRVLDEVKTLVGDCDRLVAEVRTLLPAKRRPSAKKGRARKKGARRARATSRRKSPAAKRRAKPAPAVRTQRTTIVSSPEPRDRATG